MQKLKKQTPDTRDLRLKKCHEIEVLYDYFYKQSILQYKYLSLPVFYGPLLYQIGVREHFFLPMGILPTSRAVLLLLLLCCCFR